MRLQTQVGESKQRRRHGQRISAQIFVPDRLAIAEPVDILHRFLVEKAMRSSSLIKCVYRDAIFMSGIIYFYFSDSICLSAISFSDTILSDFVSLTSFFFLTSCFFDIIFLSDIISISDITCISDTIFLTCHLSSSGHHQAQRAQRGIGTSWRRRQQPRPGARTSPRTNWYFYSLSQH